MNALKKLLIMCSVISFGAIANCSEVQSTEGILMSAVEKSAVEIPTPEEKMVGQQSEEVFVADEGDFVVVDEGDDESVIDDETDLVVDDVDED